MESKTKSDRKLRTDENTKKFLKVEQDKKNIRNANLNSKRGKRS